ncbi:MAG: exo-alpha-sialidase [Spirochaetaceae bacterium]|nr:exo-alpha-sialidase [Spirochaetaceae bacterium]
MNSKIGLALYDGAARILPGETVGWPDTIFGDPATKTLTLKNDGSKNVTLSGPLIVSKTGGGGQAAYGGIVQPVQLTLAPGASTSFSVDFTPAAPDADYACDFVINSNDASFPAYAFSGSGHSTQWHGSKAIVSAAGTTYFYCPKLAYVASPTPTLYAAYKVYDSATPANSGIAIRSSVDGGKTWSAATLVVASTDVGGFSFTASSYGLHLFYSLTSANTCHYCAAPSGTLSFTWTGSFSFGTNYYNPGNEAISCANGQVYVAAYDNTSSPKKLYLYVRQDGFYSYMGSTIPWDFTSYVVADGSTHTGGFYPTLKVDANNVYLAYTDSKVLRTARIPRSTISDPGTWSYGTAWTDASNIARDVIAIDSTRAYLFYAVSDGTGEPRLRASTDLTLGSWSTGHSFSGEGSDGSNNIVFRMPDGNRMFAVWTSRYGGVDSLRMSRSTDAGLSWSTQPLDASSGVAGSYTAMEIVGSTVYAAYSTNSPHPNGYSITIKKSLDGGATW